MADELWAWLSKGVTTVAINTAVSGDNTIHAITAGKRFCVYHLWLQAEGAVDVILKSGSTSLTGPITFAANAEKEWKNSGVGIFVGRTTGQNFVLNLSGPVQVNGFALLSEMNA